MSMSVRTNNFYQGMIRLYRAARDSEFSVDEIDAQFDALPEQFRDQIINRFEQNIIEGGTEEKDPSNAYELLYYPSHLQQVIQRIAFERVLELPETINERICQLCNEDNVENLTEAYLICLHDYAQDKELETILNDWVAMGDPEEKREEAREKILAFRSDPTRYSLFLGSLHLKTLPPIFHLQPFRERLQFFNLPRNQLTTLPPGICHLQNLTRLNLGENQLSAFPEEICELKQLKYLDVSHNPLLSLPENISNLKNLEYLMASEILLTDCPYGIFRLPENCSIDLRETLLSNQDIMEFAKIRFSPDYQGPIQISYSQKAEGSLFELNQFLKMHFPDCRLALSHFPDLIDDPKTHLPLRDWPKSISPNKHHVLTEWLRRVALSRDYETAASRPQTIAHVASAMELAQSNPLYREKFWQITEDATTRCGDRGALSILRLGRWKRVFNTDPKDIPAFTQVIVSMWPLEMLDRIAAHKIEQIRKDDPDFDEDTQVFLEYPVKLKAALGLDIDVDLNYFSVYSRVTPEDLSKAETFVTVMTSFPGEKCRFLFNEPLWFKAFASAYPEEIKGIEEYIGWKMEKLEENENATVEDYNNLQKLRGEMFINLIAFKLGLEIPEQPLEEITDWETDLHLTFGITNQAGSSSAPSSVVSEPVVQAAAASSSLASNSGAFLNVEDESAAAFLAAPGELLVPSQDNSSDQPLDEGLGLSEGEIPDGFLDNLSSPQWHSQSGEEE